MPGVFFNISLADPVSPLSFIFDSPEMLRKICTIALVILSACRKDQPVEADLPYDIFLIAGQSNTHLGYKLDSVLDATDIRIKQLGRFDAENLRVIAAAEPLQHWTATPNDIGFALTFAKLYQAQHLAANRRVLLIPCGHGSTGFSAGHWNKGDGLYADALQRTRYALSLNPGSRLVAILWHQGESDVAWLPYQQALDSMIVNMRSDIAGMQNIPFLLGGMVPYWVAQDSARMVQQAILAATPQRVAMTAYVSPYYPAVIKKTDITSIPEHYDARAQRELGRRYFRVLDSLLK